MRFPDFRDILSEARSRIQKFNQWYHNTNDAEQHSTISPLPLGQHDHLEPDAQKLRTYFERLRFTHLGNQPEPTAEELHNLDQTYQHYVQRHENWNEPFELYRSLQDSELPPNRYPSPGLTVLPLRYHSGIIVEPTHEVPVTGFEPHPLIQYLVDRKYQEYKTYLRSYCRPLDTTQATFEDFNKEQIPVLPLTEEQIARTLPLVTHFLNAQPYLPLHFVDTRRMKTPLSTGTGYFQRFSYTFLTHAAYAHSKLYQRRPTSKGYFFNTIYQYGRTWLHYIKRFSNPFHVNINTDPSGYYSSLKRFFQEHATMLFTRIHISDRDGNLKVRPVYAVDDFFILLEGMCTFPLHAMARIPINGIKSSIMYSYETIRGGCAQLDWIAQSFSSFLCIDWSSYDQRLPRCITDLFWTRFLRSLIVISHGYQPTFEYPTYPDLDEHALYTYFDNILHFLHTWYNNMVFVTADGFSYIRNYCGVPSGLLNTQYLDSFGNLFILIDSLFEFGCNKTEIMEIVFFVMGDDNVLFTHWNEDRLYAFLVFIENYALTRYNMILSKKKSLLTVLRSRIEILSYQLQNGMPTRPIGKLVAQLAYPEHGPKDKYMSARAIGLAYAACGQDPTFHEFCFDVYHMFLPFAAPMDQESIQVASAYMPGYFKQFERIAEFIDFTRFPTIDHIRNKIRKWQGFLSLDTKWDPNWFVNPPYAVPLDAKTMTDYQVEHSLLTRETPFLFQQV
ncbi:RNA-dependent RNA polymerase [Trichoderma citrinoviride partitivirus 1]|nr:RNA-dependent RNA polymerase [Trichoderma citrinoviride partitivirus 1]